MKNRTGFWTLLTAACFMLSCLPGNAADVRNTTSYTDEKTGITVLEGELDVPAEGLWHELPAGKTDGISSIQVVAPEEVMDRLRDEYMVPRRSRGGRGMDIDKPVKSIAPAAERTVSYSVYAVRIGGEKIKPARFSIRNRQTGEKIECYWDASSAAKTEDSKILKNWAKARGLRWLYYAIQAPSPVMDSWMDRASAIYGVSVSDRLGGGGRRGETTDMFGVLGGRAAVRETLQMQALRTSGKKVPSAAPGVPIAEVKGVQVKSHPFDEMLRGDKGVELEFACNVPCDRALIYFARPAALLPFLDDGESFIFRTGMPLTKSSISYDLKTKYLQKLGVDEAWLKMALASGAVKESAIILPDLFLVDGTDMTVISRISEPRAFASVLKIIGIKDLGKDVKVVKTKDGGEAFWAMSDSLMVFSTNRKELDRVLDLQKNKGKDSLGDSAEFRYMLTKLPVLKETRAYVYLSDPFIRQLVGPEVKIAQLRRLSAKAEMEMLTGAALLYKADGHTGDIDVK